LLKKIKRSLNVKTFFWIFITLALTFFASFTSMGSVLSRTYEREFIEQFNLLVTELPLDLERASEEELLDIITSFAFRNHANVILELEDEEIRVGSATFSTDEEIELLTSRVATRHSTTGEMMVLTVEVSKQPLTQVLETTQGILIPLFLFTFLVTLTSSWIFARRLTKPIILISQVSKRMQQLDLKARCDLKREDEIGVLADNLNEMADKVENSLSNLQVANSLLQEREEQQKEFFTAASHELKTPLTILSTQLDGMIKNIGEYQDRDLHLKLARETTNSMSDLIGKLLSIAQMQSSVIEIKKTKINLSQLVEKSCFDHSELAIQKNVSLSHFCEPDIEILANRSKLELVLSNILSNAIVHSPQHGFVDIQLEVNNNHGILTVENYNAKIAENDLNRIFEAFYRTDQSRSRYTGGSGLGLHMTKNILETHDFDYNLENSENGVVFWIKFPLIN